MDDGSCSRMLRGPSQLSLTEFLGYLGYYWICLALSGNDSSNSNLHPPFLLSHLRHTTIESEVGDLCPSGTPDHLSGSLLHLAILLLPPFAYGLAPT